MTDWIARANARFAESGVTPAAKTDESPVPSVSAAPVAQDEHAASGSFDSFGSTSPLPFVKTSITPVSNELLPIPSSTISADQKAVPIVCQTTITGPNKSMTEVSTAISEHDAGQATAGLLEKFELDWLQTEIRGYVEAGYPADDIRRTINIAFHLIAVNKFEFDRAMQAAAEWVIDNPEHPAEAGFVDVMLLYHHGRQGHATPAEFTDDGDDLVPF
jgi:hypothetical protein